MTGSERTISDDLDTGSSTSDLEQGVVKGDAR
jgi:hypothetical protein